MHFANRRFDRRQHCLRRLSGRPLCYLGGVSSAEEFKAAVGVRPVQASLKNEIVRVAVELGTELGEDGLTMRGIASRLGVSATALYQHFEGKSSILHAIRFHGLAMINDVLERCFEGHESMEAIAAVSRAYIQFARDNKWLYGVLFSGEGIDYSSLAEDEHRLVYMSHDKVVDAFRKAKQAGVLREDVDVEKAPLLLWAANHGLACLMINGRLGTHPGAMNVEDEQKFIDDFVELSVRGFRRARA